ncbi:MAG TPA: type II secretion system F family protein [Umezawaea sp.]|nr:type II secretion system F family protein [Umezawaea sp.]
MGPTRAVALGTEAGPGYLLLVVGLGALFLGLFSAVLLMSRRRRTVSVAVTAIERYRSSRAAPPSDTSAKSALFRFMLHVGDRSLSQGRRERNAARLDLARLSLTPAEWLVIRSAVAGFAAGGLGVLTKSTTGLVIGLVLGWFASRAFLRRRVAKRRAAFADQLPDTLQLLVGALQAGFSLPQALDTVVREDTQPIAGEIARALARTRLGASLEEALEIVAHRMGSPDFVWLVMAIRIQRHVGGNLAELLLTTVHTMRERSSLRRQVRALSAEGKLSAYVLIGLPIMLALWMFISRREYIAPLYTTTLGLVLLGAGVTCVALGWFWMSTLIKVKV